MTNIMSEYTYITFTTIYKLPEYCLPVSFPLSCLLIPCVLARSSLCCDIFKCLYRLAVLPQWCITFLCQGRWSDQPSAAHVSLTAALMAPLSQVTARRQRSRTGREEEKEGRRCEKLTERYVHGCACSLMKWGSSWQLLSVEEDQKLKYRPHHTLES